MKAQRLRAAMYVRASTKSQEEEDQEPDLFAHIKKDGAIIKDEHIFRDNISSSKKNKEDRKGLTRLRTLTKNDIDIVYIWEIARLARKPKEFQDLIEEFKEKNINVCFLKPNTLYIFDPKTGEEDLATSVALNLFATYAMYEIKNKVARTVRGQQASIHLKGNSYTTKAPFGYKIVDKKFVLNYDKLSDYEGYSNPVEAVKTIFNLYSRGKQLSLIIKELNDRNIISPMGKKWTRGVLLSLLRNEVYYGKKEIYSHTRDPKTYKIIKTETHNIETPAIITEDQFLFCRKQAELNKSVAAKSYKREYILRGLVKCGFCGNMYLVNSTNGRFFYVCSDSRKGSNTKKGCQNTAIDINKLDKMVWYTVRETYIMYKKQNLKEVTIKGLQKKIVDCTSLIKNKEKEIANLIKSMKNLVDSIAESTDSSTRAFLNSKLNELGNQKSQYHIDIEKIKGEKGNYESQKLTLENLDAGKLNVENIDNNPLLKEDALKEIIDYILAYKINKQISIYNIQFKEGGTYDIIYRRYKRDYTIPMFAKFDPANMKYRVRSSNGEEILTEYYTVEDFINKHPELEFTELDTIS